MTTFPASFADDELLARVAANLVDVRRRIEASAADPGRVTLVAVTKGFGAREVLTARVLGLTAVGENYVEELERKRADAPEDLTWHFLGALQSNKLARVLAAADVISSVSRDKEIELIARRRPGTRVDIQVNFSAIAARNGAAPHDVERLVVLARERELNVRGLMVVAPPGDEVTVFGATRALCDALALSACSMGMSEDLEVACAAGSTELRVGRALFGPRPGPLDLA